MDMQIDNTSSNQDADVEFTRKLKAMGVTPDAIADIIVHLKEAETRIAGELVERFDQVPRTMVAFGEELSSMTRRIQGLGVAMIALEQEHADDGYVQGIHQMVLDLECNAHRMQVAFDLLLTKHHD